MRTIKFRAWDELNQEMVYEKTGIFSGGKSSWEILKLYENVMQFTGLHDNKGKEIYEGDIVKAHSHKPTDFKIEFIEGGFCAARNGIEYPININHFYPSIGCTIEVIGNIYEHPHLLGGE